MQMTLRYTFLYRVTHKYERAIDIPFIPQIGMHIAIGDCIHTVNNVTWHESSGAIVVDVNELNEHWAENGWAKIE